MKVLIFLVLLTVSTSLGGCKERSVVEYLECTPGISSNIECPKNYEWYLGLWRKNND